MIPATPRHDLLSVQWISTKCILRRTQFYPKPEAPSLSRSARQEVTLTLVGRRARPRPRGAEPERMRSALFASRAGRTCNSTSSRAQTRRGLQPLRPPMAQGSTNHSDAATGYGGCLLRCAGCLLGEVLPRGHLLTV
jgi:hypothetical protein